MQTYQPTSYEYNPALTSRQPPRSRGGLFTKLAVILILLFGAGSGGVFYYLNNLPEKQFDKMILALESVHSVEYDGELTVSFDSPDSLQVLEDNPAILSQIMQAPFTEAANSSGTLYSKFRGKSDSQDKENPSAALAMGLRVKGDQFQMGTDEDIVLSGQLILKDKNLYVKATSLPSSLGMEMSLIKDLWIRFPLDSASTSAYPLYGSSPILQATESAELYKKYQSEIEKAYVKNRFLVASIKERNVVIDNLKTTHYTFSLDKAKFSNFLRDFAKIYQERKITEDELNDLTKMMEVIKNFVFDMWLGDSNHLPYKLTFKSDIEVKSPSPGKASVQLDLNYKKYNQQMNIIAPDASKTFEELYGSYYGSSDASYLEE